MMRGGRNRVARNAAHPLVRSRVAAATCRVSSGDRAESIQRTVVSSICATSNGAALQACAQGSGGPYRVLGRSSYVEVNPNSVSDLCAGERREARDRAFVTEMAPKIRHSRQVCAAMSTVATDGKATEAIIALRYWARATGYELTQAEKDAIARCAEHERQLWRAGILVGGGVGLGLASAVRVPMVQRIAVGVSFASAGAHTQGSIPRHQQAVCRPLVPTPCRVLSLAVCSQAASTASTRPTCRACRAC